MSEGDTKLMTIDEAAAMLRVSAAWVSKACRQGLIDHVRVGAGAERFRRMPLRSSVEAFIQNQTRQTTQRVYEHVRRRGRMPVVLRY